KHTTINYGDTKINIIDTPGHADFSGEVERVLGMVGSVLLIIDAQDGPMPQTRFVLSKALKLGLKPIVVVNKIDRPTANPDYALDKTFDLFVELGATDEQLDFKHCYSSAVEGYAMLHLDEERVDMRPLFDLILSAAPAPTDKESDPFCMQVMTVGYDDYVGRQATGRILGGSVKKGQRVLRTFPGGAETYTITRVEGYQGLKRIEIPEGKAGDIVTLSGVEDVLLGDSLSCTENPRVLPPINLDEPTLAIEVSVSNGPFVGRDGKHVTFNKIRERLLKEKKANISLRIDEDENSKESISVAGRGELHLAVLLEAMRREGFEMCVSKPKVILKEIDGVKYEPIEKVFVEVPEEYSGPVIEALSRRKGEMQSLSTTEQGITEMEFLVPTRGLMGYRDQFLTVTRGLGILTSIFDSYQPHKGVIPGRGKGALISMNQGPATTYTIGTLQERGTLFVSPGEDVYEGMVVGEHVRDNDLMVNLTKAKQLTNFRASGNDENVMVTPARKFTLEQAIDWIADDELVEITPKTIRLRKRFLKENDRKRVKP
ncbi:MAG: GTP-binding protein, partial [Chlamydiia bacterium]|nr:GTP-binding protein [Chlamydiia bacterium]